MQIGLEHVEQLVNSMINYAIDKHPEYKIQRFSTSKLARNLGENRIEWEAPYQWDNSPGTFKVSMAIDTTPVFGIKAQKFNMP